MIFVFDAPLYLTTFLLCYTDPYLYFPYVPPTTTASAVLLYYSEIQTTLTLYKRLCVSCVRTRRSSDNYHKVKLRTAALSSTFVIRSYPPCTMRRRRSVEIPPDKEVIRLIQLSFTRRFTLRTPKYLHIRITYSKYTYPYPSLPTSLARFSDFLLIFLLTFLPLFLSAAAILIPPACSSFLC